MELNAGVLIGAMEYMGGCNKYTLCGLIGAMKYMGGGLIKYTREVLIGAMKYMGGGVIKGAQEGVNRGNEIYGGRDFNKRDTGGVLIGAMEYRNIRVLHNKIIWTDGGG